MKNLKIVKTCFSVFIILLFLFVVVSAFYIFYIPKKYEKSVKKYSNTFGIESELVFAVIRAESNFDKNAVSRSGAVGLMQILPETANYILRLFEKTRIPDLKDADTNIFIGVGYLTYLKMKFCTLTEVLAAYNAGEGTVRNWLRNTDFSENGITLCNIPYRETREYVKRVKKFYNYYKIFYF